jgi:alpha-beta hydrolase superfamily lysophospholipase
MPSLKFRSILIVSVLVLLYYKLRKQKQQQHQNKNTIYATAFTNHPEDKTSVDAKLVAGLAYFHQHKQLGNILGKGNINVSYARFSPSATSRKGTILFLPGWYETMIKYGDFIQELVEQHQFEVVVIDHRSQGFSDRVLKLPSIGEEAHHHLKSHVEHLHDYVSDALLILNKERIDYHSSNFILMGFSLGGLIASELNKLIPCSKLVLVAPCLYSKLPVSLPTLLFQLLIANLFTKTSFVLGHPRELSHNLLLPPNSRVTSSASRVEFWMKLRKDYPQVCINGLTWSQLLALTSGDHSHSRFTQPILLLTAELDLYVDNQVNFQFANNNLVKHVHFCKAKHELLHEREEIRTRVVQEIVSFII